MPLLKINAPIDSIGTNPDQFYIFDSNKKPTFLVFERSVKQKGPCVTSKLTVTLEPGIYWLVRLSQYYNRSILVKIVVSDAKVACRKIACIVGLQNTLCTEDGLVQNIPEHLMQLVPS
jgi:hypothetical protein